MREELKDQAKGRTTDLFVGALRFIISSVPFVTAAWAWIAGLRGPMLAGFVVGGVSLGLLLFANWNRIVAAFSVRGKALGSGLLLLLFVLALVFGPDLWRGYLAAHDTPLARSVDSLMTVTAANQDTIKSLREALRELREQREARVPETKAQILAKHRAISLGVNKLIDEGMNIIKKYTQWIGIAEEEKSYVKRKARFDKWDKDVLAWTTANLQPAQVIEWEAVTRDHAYHEFPQDLYGNPGGAREYIDVRLGVLRSWLDLVPN